MTLQRPPHDVPRCGGCLHAKLRAADSVTCFRESAPWYGATLSRFDKCDEHQPKVLVAAEGP